MEIKTCCYNFIHKILYISFSQSWPCNIYMYFPIRYVVRVHINFSERFATLTSDVLHTRLTSVFWAQNTRNLLLQDMYMVILTKNLLVHYNELFWMSILKCCSNYGINWINLSVTHVQELQTIVVLLLAMTYMRLSGISLRCVSLRIFFFLTTALNLIQFIVTWNVV